MKKIFFTLTIIIFFSSCQSGPQSQDPQRKTISFKLTNKGYSSPQMSLNQINTTIHSIATLAMVGWEYVQDGSGNISLSTATLITSFDYSPFTNDRNMLMYQNNYSITEVGVIKYRQTTTINGKKVSTIIHRNSQAVLEDLVVNAVRNNAERNSKGHIYAVGNININEIKGNGDGLFVIVPAK